MSLKQRVGCLESQVQVNNSASDSAKETPLRTTLQDNHVFHASWVVDDVGLQARVATGDSQLEIILGQQSCSGTGETEEEEQASERVLLPPRVASRA